jgi:Tfp pilus assembly protein PilO
MELIAFVDKNKNKILNLAVIMVAFIIASNIHKQQTKEIESLKSKKNMETKKNTAIENISKLEKSINVYKNVLVKKDVSSVINTVSNIAKESGVKIISVRPVSEKKYPDYIKFPFSLMLSAADYHTLGRFISKIESYQDVYLVEAMDIRSQEQKKELTVNLTISSIAFIP